MRACGSNHDKARATPRTTTTQKPVATTGPPVGSTAPAQPQPLTAVKLKLTAVARLAQPIALAVRSGDDGLYVAEKPGRVRLLRDGKLVSTPVLDISNLVTNAGEQGFLGAAFSPDGTRLYVHYTDRGGDGRIVEYTMKGDRADTSTRREILFFDDPFPNHNGGNLVFGPDKMLWIGMGDSGSAGDPNDNAQSLGTLFGKILRIDPRPSGGRPYTIPPDNPFVGRAAPVPRSGPTACATRGAIRSTAARATSGSATWARARGRRSTSSPRARAAARTSVGRAARATTRSRARRRRERWARSTSTARATDAR